MNAKLFLILLFSTSSVYMAETPSIQDIANALKGQQIYGLKEDLDPIMGKLGLTRVGYPDGYGTGGSAGYMFDPKKSNESSVQLSRFDQKTDANELYCTLDAASKLKSAPLAEKIHVYQQIKGNCFSMVIKKDSDSTLTLKTAE